MQGFQYHFVQNWFSFQSSQCEVLLILISIYSFRFVHFTTPYTELTRKKTHITKILMFNVFGKLNIAICNTLITIQRYHCSAYRKDKRICAQILNEVVKVSRIRSGISFSKTYD